MIKCCFFHCQQWCVILCMFLMLMELSQNKVIQKEHINTPMWGFFSVYITIFP